ncbi:MAG TPA: YebC/PmpR family DNA-binding transcriptional regulator [Phycisphaerae bacterium]|nr:YebC/PmpR family DNA-binding transcriptional regulator [Phycisphaerae bacterium]
MAGHSHWKNIKRKKAVVDARRGQAWSKIARLIMIAAKRGSNPDDNLALRFAIDKARAVNMPNDTIEKAVKKGSGELGATNFEQVNYEGYGPGGVAIMVDALTDNRNRTAGEVRLIFDKHGGAVGAANSVGWMFSKKGVINIERVKIDEEKLMEIALEAGAEDVQTSEEGYEVTTTVADFEKVRKALLAAKIEVAQADIMNIPSQTVSVSGDAAEKLQKIVDGLEANDDVQNVFTNADVQDDVAVK